MSNLMQLHGKINEVKSFDNADGSKKLFITLMSRTADRSPDNQNKTDFWDVDLYIPKGREGVVPHLVKDKAISIAGVPVKQHKEEDGVKRTYVKCVGEINFLQLH